MNKKRIFPSIVLGILILGPVLLILFLKLGKNSYVDLPHFGNKIPLSKGDTLYHKVPTFSFLNQDSMLFKSESLKGKIYVAQFFFTSCPSICPPMTNNLLKVYSHYGMKEDSTERQDFNIVSFSIDPKNDSPLRLRNFRKKYKIKGNGWQSLTGNRDSIYNLMNENGFLLLKPEWSENPNAIRHTELVVLVDKESHIRGMYDATKEKEIDRLMDEIRLLYVKYANPNNK